MKNDSKNAPPESPESAPPTSTMNWPYRILCWCGGANVLILQNYRQEWDKFMGAGSMVVITGLFAVVSSSFALSTVFGFNILILLVALIWGCFIFMLDRYLITNISTNGSDLQRFLTAIIRLLLACFLGVLISRPLELRIFKEEIEYQLSDSKKKRLENNINEYKDKRKQLETDYTEKRKNTQASTKIKDLDTAIEESQKQVEAAQASIEAQEAKLDAERDGKIIKKYKGNKVISIGTGQEGEGSRFRAKQSVNSTLMEPYVATIKNQSDKQKKYSDIIAKLQEERLVEINTLSSEEEKAKARLNSSERSDSTLIQTTFATSLMARNKALNEYIAQDKTDSSGALDRFLICLFIVIEMAPVMAKLVSSSGPYEQEVEVANEADLKTSYLRLFMNHERFKKARVVGRQRVIDDREIELMAGSKRKDAKLNDLDTNLEAYQQYFSQNGKE